MTRRCSGDVSGRAYAIVYVRCANSATWDILAASSDQSVLRVTAVCHDCLADRLEEWYDALKDCNREAFTDAEWFVQVRPYDAAFIDPDEADEADDE